MALLKLVESESSLYEEITLSPSVLGKRVDFLYSFLSSLGFSSLSEISVNTLKAFITTVRHEFAFSPKQYSAYKGDLETVYFAYMKENGHPLTVSSFAETARGRKCLTFLMVSAIYPLNFFPILNQTFFPLFRYIIIKFTFSILFSI